MAISKLPGDLPENWKLHDAVTPNGEEAGLDEKHGFNYLMKQVNKAHSTINEMIDTDTESDKAIGQLQARVESIDNNKVDKVSGKGLSANDYTTAEKNKLAGLSNYDDTELRSDVEKLKQYPINVPLVLLAANWIDNQYLIESDQLQSNTSGMLSAACLTNQEYAALRAARISRSYELTTGILTITALGTVPEVDINLKLTINDSGGFIIDLPSDGGDADTLGKKEPAYFASKADYLELLQRIEAAEENLNKKIDKNCSPQFFLPSTGWDENNQQTLLCDKFVVGSTIIPAYIMPKSNIDACSKAGISIHSNTNTTITFSCSNVPDVDVVVGAMYQGESDVTYEIIDEIGEKVITWYTEEMLPDPNVLLLINAEDSSISDKSGNNNQITLNSSNIILKSESIAYVAESSNWERSTRYFKGKMFIRPVFADSLSNDGLNYGGTITSVKNWDATKEWEICFCYGHERSGQQTKSDFPAVFIDGIGCGYALEKGATNLILYYRDVSTGIIQKRTISLSSFGNASNYEHSGAIRIMYKQVDGVWKYIYEILINNYSNVPIEIETKPITANDNTAINLCGCVRYASSSYNKSWLDEFVLRGKITENYVPPKYNKRDDEISLLVPTMVEHIKTIQVTDNTILRHNTDGTVDKCTDVITPIPYVPTSNTIMLLGCDEMKATDECGNAVTYYENVSVDTENKVLGIGSFKVDRIFKQTDLGFQVITNKAVKNTSKITFECNLLLDINDYQSAYKNIYLLEAWDKTNNNYYGFGINFVYTSSSNKWELRLSISESGTSFDSGSPTLYSFDEAEIFGKWIHLAVAIDFPNHNCKIYLDGVCVKSGAYSSYIPWNGNFNRFKIAYTNLTASSINNFGGYIDEIRLSEGMLETFGNTKTEKEWVKL